MRAMRLAPLCLALLACGGGTSPPAGPAPAPAAPAAPAAAPAAGVQSRLAWLVGRWQSDAGIEHWTAAGDALFGASFTVSGGRTSEFEAMFVRDHEGATLFEAAPQGGAVVAFPMSRGGAGEVEFENRGHDFPQVIRYHRDGDRLTAHIEGGGGAGGRDFAWQPAAAGRAEALEQADRDWAVAVADRGVDAWVAGFAPDGAMRGGDGSPVRGADAIRAAMSPVLAGSMRLDWAPLASGLSPAGDMGYTVGRWTLYAGTVAKVRGGYLTIWQRQPDGSWKVAYDGGDAEG